MDVPSSDADRPGKPRSQTAGTATSGVSRIALLLRHPLSADYLLMGAALLLLLLGLIMVMSA